MAAAAAAAVRLQLATARAAVERAVELFTGRMPRSVPALRPVSPVGGRNLAPYVIREAGTMQVERR